MEAGLRGAFLLARGRPEGLAIIEAMPDFAIRSFWAAAVCLPGFLALRLLAWSNGGSPAAGPWLGLLAELIGYAVAWAGFALASKPFAEAQGKRAEWPRFIAAWNWANVVQYVVLLAVTLPSAIGLPGSIGSGLGLAALGYALWLEWFVARTALKLPGGQAALLVAIDLAIGVFINGVVERIGLG